jgi:hypothetical protein
VTARESPWWASGRAPEDGIAADEDPLDAHRNGRRPDADAALATDAIDLLQRLASELGRRISSRSAANAAGPPPGAFTRPDAPGAAEAPASAWRALVDGLSPHEDGEVCSACPICIGLRAVRQVRPDVIGHLSDAAHHLSLALRAFAEAQTGGGGFESIDLEP